MNNMYKKKGQFFTIDAILAAGIFFTVIVLVSSVYVADPQKASVSFLSQDTVRVFTNLKVDDLDNGHVKNLIALGVITRTNNTLLEQIGEFWAEDKIEIARNFTNQTLDALIPERFGIGVYVDGEEIYNRNIPVTRTLVSSKKIISGIAKAKPIEGFTSRAFISSISSKTNTKFIPFDVIAPYTYTGSGAVDNILIEYSTELPDDAVITDAEWIIISAWAPSTSVNAYVNDNLVFSGVPPDD